MMKKTVLYMIALSALFFLPTLTISGFESEGVWELEHLYSQKLSVGIVTDLYPSDGEWAAGMLIKGIQFLNHNMAFLHCETASGVQTIDLEVFYKVKTLTRKHQITFVLKNEEEIQIFVFDSEDGSDIFSYCDAGPQAGVATGLYGSRDKIVFRNHFGYMEKISE